MREEEDFANPWVSVSIGCTICLNPKQVKTKSDQVQVSVVKPWDRVERGWGCHRFLRMR
jgi:hypothetical protein